MDYPALVFPVSHVKETDKVDTSYVPINEKDKWNHELYSPERYKDAPVSLQLVGRRYDYEKVIQTMEFIRGAVELPLAS